MHPVVLPDRPQDAMFDVVEGYFFAFDGQDLGPPRAAGEQARRDIDIADRLHGEARQNQLHRFSVVKIDPVGALLGSTIVRDAAGLQALNVIAQRRAILRCHRPVAHPIDAVGLVHHILFEKTVPGAMIDLLLTRRLAFLPARPEFRFRRRVQLRSSNSLTRPKRSARCAKTVSSVSGLESNLRLRLICFMLLLPPFQPFAKNLLDRRRQFRAHISVADLAQRLGLGRVRMNRRR